MMDIEGLRKIFLPILDAQGASFDAAFARLEADFGAKCVLDNPACPVQIHITLPDGRLLYYRERHGGWEILSVKRWEWYLDDDWPPMLGSGDIGPDQTDSWSDGVEFERNFRAVITTDAADPAAD